MRERAGRCRAAYAHCLVSQCMWLDGLPQGFDTVFDTAGHLPRWSVIYAARCSILEWYRMSKNGSTLLLPICKCIIV